MFRKLIIAVIIAFMILSCMSATISLPGGYRLIGNEERKILEKDKTFVTSLQLAKIKLLAKSKGKIIKLDKIYAQVVAGTNYNFNFDTTQGPYEVKVFCQPWTKTYKVTSITLKAKGK